MQAKIRFSNKAKAAITAGDGNTAALRRVAKRHKAVAIANPFIVATVGLKDVFLYCKGVLCYTLNNQVRVLDLYNSGQHKTIISIPGLLTYALIEIEDNRGVFQILY
jgi:hypothetical protein